MLAGALTSQAHEKREPTSHLFISGILCYKHWILSQCFVIDVERADALRGRHSVLFWIVYTKSFRK